MSVRISTPLVNGGLGIITSVSNSDGTLTISPTTGAVDVKVSASYTATRQAAEFINAIIFG